MATPKIYIGTDHAGFELKEKLVPFLKSLGYEVEDKGAFSYDEADDYPDFVMPVAEAVNRHPSEVKGIILGGSGQGEDMAADKLPHVRSAVYYGGPLEIVKLSREHNDANILSLGARFVTEEEAKEAVRIFVETPFSGDERHVRRLKEFDPEYDG